MTKEEMIALLEKLPPTTDVFWSFEDDAWVPEIRVFKTGEKTSAYIRIGRMSPSCADFGKHVNFPEGHRGAVEIDIKETA